MAVEQRALNLFNCSGYASAKLAAGIDEAGRGCLAGPVIACAVILPPDFTLKGLADSKSVPAKQRESIAAELRAKVIAWSLGIVWPAQIDKINILQATFEAMAKACASLKIAPTYLEIDGNQKIPRPVLSQWWKSSCKLPMQQAIIKGDALIPAISAASILAKTYRDRLMAHFAKKWPFYGFETHKGYGTKHHFEALKKYGPSPFHRLTFKGVLPKENLSEDSLQKISLPGLS